MRVRVAWRAGEVAGGRGGRAHYGRRGGRAHYGRTGCDRRYRRVGCAWRCGRVISVPRLGRLRIFDSLIAFGTTIAHAVPNTTTAATQKRRRFRARRLFRFRYRSAAAGGGVGRRGGVGGGSGRADRAGVGAGSLTGTSIAVEHFGQSNVLPARSSPSVNRVLHLGQKSVITTGDPRFVAFVVSRVPGCDATQTITESRADNPPRIHAPLGDRGTGYLPYRCGEPALWGSAGSMDAAASRFNKSRRHPATLTERFGQLRPRGHDAGQVRGILRSRAGRTYGFKA